MTTSAPHGYPAPNGGFDSPHFDRPWYAFCACILLGTLLLDVYTPERIPASLLYLLAVAAGGMVSSTRVHWIVAAISTGLTVLGLYGAWSGGISRLELTNRAISVGAIWLTAWIVSRWQKDARSRSHDLSARLRSLLTHTQTIIFVKDLQGRYLEVSEQFLALTGAPADLVIGKSDYELFPHDVADSYREHDRQVIKAGGVMSFEEYALLNGEPRFYVVRKFPLRAECGQIVAVGGVATDMTARLQSEVSRHEAQERLDLVVAATQTGMWDWDLQTNTMYYSARWKSSLGYEEREISHSPSEWESRLHPDDKKRALALVDDYRFVELIEREIQRLAAIVKKMYTLYQDGASDQWQATNVNDLLQNVTTLLDCKLASRRIRLRTEVDLTCPVVTLPRADLFQVLLNLVQNAIDASRAEMEVVLKVAQHSDMLQWSVMDHGIGMAADVLPRIFEPFFTTKSADGRQGLGLGLSVSRRLVRAMGGRIEVQTQPAGGSTFTVIHPLNVPGDARQQGALQTREKEEINDDYAQTHSHC